MGEWLLYCMPGNGQRVQGLFSAQFICLGNGRDDVREDVFLAKLFNKANFVEVAQYIVVYTAENHLNAVF